MVSQPLRIPDAEDIDVLGIEPKRELQSCNHLLGDHEALMRFHDEEGYILLRNVLDPASVEEARKSMFTVMERHGLIEPGAIEPIWTGKPFDQPMEEGEEFAGIARKLIEHPVNLKVMEQILGEPAEMILNTQYRAYPPGGSITGVHQDGFYSQGITKFRPVWTPLTNCEREVGGLMIAVRQCNRGYFHNVAKSPPHIPEGVIPDDAWATTDYFPGDVLVLNPFTPHASMPNRSTRCRVTLDTRIQSAADPKVLVGVVVEAKDTSIRVRKDDGVEHCFTVDDQTMIRIQSPGVPEKRAEYAARVEPGRTVRVVMDGDRAVMLRRSNDR